MSEVTEAKCGSGRRSMEKCESGRRSMEWGLRSRRWGVTTVPPHVRLHGVRRRGLGGKEW